MDSIKKNVNYQEMKLNQIHPDYNANYNPTPYSDVEEFNLDVDNTILVDDIPFDKVSSSADGVRNGNFVKISDSSIDYWKEKGTHLEYGDKDYGDGVRLIYKVNDKTLEKEAMGFISEADIEKKASEKERINEIRKEKQSRVVDEKLSDDYAREKAAKRNEEMASRELARNKAIDAHMRLNPNETREEAALAVDRDSRRTDYDNLERTYSDNYKEKVNDMNEYQNQSREKAIDAHMKLNPNETRVEAETAVDKDARRTDYNNLGRNYTDKYNEKKAVIDGINMEKSSDISQVLGIKSENISSNKAQNTIQIGPDKIDVTMHNGVLDRESTLKLIEHAKNNNDTLAEKSLRAFYDKMYGPEISNPKH